MLLYPLRVAMYKSHHKISGKDTLGGAELRERGLSFIRPNGIAVKEWNCGTTGRYVWFYDNLTAHILYYTANNQNFSHL